MGKTLLHRQHILVESNGIANTGLLLLTKISVSYGSAKYVTRSGTRKRKKLYHNNQVTKNRDYMGT